MDEAIAHAVVDLSGRATAKISITPDEGMVAHAFESLVQTARITLHVTATGENAITSRRRFQGGRSRPGPGAHQGRLTRSFHQGSL